MTTILSRRPWSMLYWLPTGFVLSTYFYDLKIITGRSMQPTLNPHSSPSRDIALFDILAVKDKNYGRNDIVALRSPENPHRILVKRILAIEGDVVRTLPPYPDYEVTVPEGHIWIEGDEPFFSDDSNRFGPVSASLLQSKLVMLVWPPERFGRISSGPPSQTPFKGSFIADELRRISRVTVSKPNPVVTEKGR